MRIGRWELTACRTHGWTTFGPVIGYPGEGEKWERAWVFYLPYCLVELVRYPIK